MRSIKHKKQFKAQCLNISIAKVKKKSVNLRIKTE